ncbi:MAG: flagellar protein FlaG [Deltaproteobacteria bacterium]|nr:flagellar protein FlaG [Deltaproteobacteria bacterium]
MDIRAVETNSAITGEPAIAAVPIPQMGPGQTRQASAEDAEVNNEKMRQMIESMQEQIDSMNVSLQYSTYGERGEKISVTVVNKDTGEVVREIPAKELQSLYAKMSELAGMIFNRKV